MPFVPLAFATLIFPDIFERPSYFVLPPWCIGPPAIVLGLVHLMKDRTDASVYEQTFMEIRDSHRDYIPVYTDGSCGLRNFHKID